MGCGRVGLEKSDLAGRRPWLTGRGRRWGREGQIGACVKWDNYQSGLGWLPRGEMLG